MILLKLYSSSTLREPVHRFNQLIAGFAREKGQPRSQGHNVVFVWDSTAITEKDVPDQTGTLSQVGTRKISKGGWTI